MKKIILLLLLLLIINNYPAAAQDENMPNYHGYVNDFAAVLSPGTELMLTSLAEQIENKTTAQIAIATIGTVEPLTIEQYAVELFERWGIGQKGKDNGVLILLAVSDRAVRIETGYGLEGALPDAVCNRIIYQVMIPEFKKGDLEKGIVKGMIAVAESVANEYNINLDLDKDLLSSNNLTPAEPEIARFIKILVLLIIVISIFGRSGLLYLWFPTLYMGKRRNRKNYWYGGGFSGGSGGFGGGFGGFGGGLGGGGGATGRW